MLNKNKIFTTSIMVFGILCISPSINADENNIIGNNNIIQNEMQIIRKKLDNFVLSYTMNGPSLKYNNNNAAISNMKDVMNTLINLIKAQNIQNNINIEAIVDATNNALQAVNNAQQCFRKPSEYRNLTSSLQEIQDLLQNQ